MKVRGDAVRGSVRGFSLVELIIVLVLMAIILMIATPGMIRWYNRQRFSQNVQRVLSSLRVAQFSAVSTGYWMLVIAYTDCHDNLQLRRLPAPLLDVFCVQRFRLPAGQCSPSAVEWAQLTSAPDGFPPCAADTPPTTMCEYAQDFWLTEPRFRMQADLPSEQPELGGPTTYTLFGPDGSMGFLPENGVATPTDCTEMNPPILMPLPNMRQELQQMRFGWPAQASEIWQAVCLSGRGRLSLTPMTPSAADLQCGT